MSGKPLLTFPPAATILKYGLDSASSSTASGPSPANAALTLGARALKAPETYPAGTVLGPDFRPADPTTIPFFPFFLGGVNDTFLNDPPIGLATQSGILGQPVSIVTSGPLTLTKEQWSLVLADPNGTIDVNDGLFPGAAYFLIDVPGLPGKIFPGFYTTQDPTKQVAVIQVGTASEDGLTLYVNIQNLTPQYPRGTFAVALPTSSDPSTFLPPGTPLYQVAAADYTGNAIVDAAQATTQTKATLVGLLVRFEQILDDSGDPVAVTGVAVTSGDLALTNDQWDAIAGTSGGLAIGTTYYLSATAGKITATAPSDPDFVIPIGVCRNRSFPGDSPAFSVLSIHFGDPVTASGGGSAPTTEHLATDNSTPWTVVADPAKDVTYVTASVGIDHNQTITLANGTIDGFEKKIVYVNAQSANGATITPASGPSATMAVATGTQCAAIYVWDATAAAWWLMSLITHP